MHRIVLFLFSSTQSWILTPMLCMNVPLISLFQVLDFQEMSQGIFCMQLFMLIYLVKVCLIPTLFAVILVKTMFASGEFARINNQCPGLLAE